VSFRVAVIGDRVAGFEPQDSIEPALAHAALALGIEPLAVSWIGTEQLDEHGPESLLADAAGVWCAPGSPFRSFAGALAGIRYAREHDRPFLGTCAGFQHAVIEIARHVAGIEAADHEEYGREGGDLLIHELLCSLVGQRLEVRLDDPVIRAWYGADAATERYYCRFGLNPVYVEPLEAAGLRVAGTDAADGEPRLMRFAPNRCFVVTLFVPQTRSTPTEPHPLVVGFTAHAAGLAFPADQE
jgi:CTP synthase (UTP-ammonia lyase)